MKTLLGNELIVDEFSHDVDMDIYEESDSDMVMYMCNVLNHEQYAQTLLPIIFC